jgi:hypothetical protein
LNSTLALEVHCVQSLHNKIDQFWNQKNDSKKKKKVLIKLLPVAR